MANKEPLWTGSFSRIWVVSLMMCCWHFTLNVPFPFYIKQLGGNELLVGITAGFFALTSLLMRPFAGWMMDNKSRSGLLIVGLVSLFIITLLYIIIPVLYVVVILRILCGFSYSGAHTSSTTNACDFIPQSRFGEGMGFLGLSNTIAAALGPLLGLAIMSTLGFPALFGTSLIFILVGVLITRTLSFKKVNQSVYVPGQKKQGFSSLFNVQALPASVIMLFSVIPFGGVSPFVALYGEYSGLGNGGFYFMLMALGTGCTRLFSGRIVDKKGEGPMILLGYGCLLLALLLLLWKISFCYYLSGLFFGLGFGLSIPAMQYMAMRIVPMEKRGSASCTFLCANDIGVGVGAMLSGLLVTVLGYRPMFGIVTVFIVISLLIYVFWASKAHSAYKKAMSQG